MSTQSVPILSWAQVIVFLFISSFVFAYTNNKTLTHERCVSECDNVKSQCRLDCEGESICDFECSLQLDQCIQSCPCFSQCLSGCTDCPNQICTCAFPDSNPDYVSCAAWVESVYTECLTSCTAGDVHCLSLFGFSYNSMINQCPCRVIFHLFKQ